MRYSVQLAFTSSPNLGALNISPDGSAFDVELGPPIQVPDSAKNIQLAVVAAAVWNTSPNVSPAFSNDKFTYTTSSAPAGTYTITIPEGLYSLTALGGYLSIEFQANGHSPSLFVLSGASATGQVAITAEVAGDSLDFTAVNSIAPLLGWANAVFTFPVAGGTLFGASVAALNRNDTYLITADFCRGLTFNGRQSRNVIGVIPINVAPGSIINYDPSNLIRVPADDLRGVTISNTRIALVNQVFQPTPTAGELYSFICDLTYEL
jgi:hypothetical protein